MAKSLFTKEIKDYILSEIARHDLVSVDDIAKIIYDLHIYNAETAEFQWCRDKARRLMASWKDKDGIRVLFAAGPASGKFINIETCQSLPNVNAAINQMVAKRDGMEVSIAKGYRQKDYLEGKTKISHSTFTRYQIIDLAYFL